jgi:curved DNA-binding protein CbpA
MSDHYQLLGVPRDAATATIRAAYARQARERHPDRFTDPEKSRRDYDQSLSVPRVAVPEQIARDAYERGLELIERRAYHEAVELLRTAVHHQPREARYHAALAQALARNPHWVREAVGEFEQAIQLEPQRAQFHSWLAELLLGQGLRLRARRAAEMALRLDPGDRTARAVLAAAAE